MKIRNQDIKNNYANVAWVLWWLLHKHAATHVKVDVLS